MKRRAITYILLENSELYAEFVPDLKSALSNMYTALTRALSEGREKRIYVIVAAKPSSPGSLLWQMIDMRHGLIVQSHNFEPASELLGVNLPIKVKEQPDIRGRGIMVDQSRQLVVQVAVCV